MSIKQLTPDELDNIKKKQIVIRKVSLRYLIKQPPCTPFARFNTPLER